MLFIRNLAIALLTVMMLTQPVDVSARKIGVNCVYIVNKTALSAWFGLEKGFRDAYVFGGFTKIKAPGFKMMTLVKGLKYKTVYQYTRKGSAIIRRHSRTYTYDDIAGKTLTLHTRGAKPTIK